MIHNRPNLMGPISLPLGVVVDKNIVLHGQLKIWDLFTHPAGQREESCFNYAHKTQSSQTQEQNQTKGLTE